MAADAAGRRPRGEAEVLADPEVRLSLTGRSGPLVVEIEYRVAQDNARAFHGVMQDVQLSRQRNGAYGWSIARDIADPELWTERYHCPTWLDFCASATARRNLNARCISAPSTFTLAPTRCGSAACWSGRSDRCAGRKRRPTAPATTYCRWSQRLRGAARSPTLRQKGASRNHRTRKSLAVVDQHLVAGLADPGAVLLQARQHRIVAIIHHGAAMASDVPGTGIVPRPLLGRGRRAQKPVRTSGTIKQNLAIWLVLTRVNEWKRIRTAPCCECLRESSCRAFRVPPPG